MEEAKRLLGHRNNDSDPITRYAKPRRWQQYFYLYVITLHVFFLFSIFTNVYQAGLARASLTKPQNLTTIFSELRQPGWVIKDEHPEEGIKNSEYDGGPSNDTKDATLEAWDKLLQPFYINASTTELLTAGFHLDLRDTPVVQLKEGGYLASLGVYQELHCLSELRNRIYNRWPTHEATNSPISLEEMEKYYVHLDRCLENLRISAMCHPDLSLYTYTWPKKKGVEAGEEEDKMEGKKSGAMDLDAHAKGERKCVDWTQIEQWSKGRSVGMTPEVVLPG